MLLDAINTIKRPNSDDFGEKVTFDGNAEHAIKRKVQAKNRIPFHGLLPCAKNCRKPCVTKAKSFERVNSTPQSKIKIDAMQRLRILVDGNML